MPSSDFEVIFVDDGSPDRTWARLKRIRSAHGNVRIKRIENSGWPSRPRNVGLAMARGEYVLFMDHDDELYPRALEAGYALAARVAADVVNGKETRTDQSKWALEVYAANGDNVIDRQDLHPLIPTNPHKLFRRQLLIDHDIRFPEGRRVLWEDVFFALDVAQHAKVISVLADTPFYHWVRGKTTASSSYHQNRREYWGWVREIVRQTNAKLAGPELADQWRLMMLHQYRSRILAPLGSSVFAASPADFAVVRETVDEMIRQEIPLELDDHLTPTQLGRSALVRAGRWDLLRTLVGIDAGLVGIGTSTSVRWVDGVLEIEASSRWTNNAGRPLALRYAGPDSVSGDRVERDLPPEVAAALPPTAIGMDGSLAAATCGLGIRGRDTAVSWMLPGGCEGRIDDVDGRPEFVMTSRASLDPRTAVFGRPLDEPTWDVTSRNELLGAINQRGLRTSIEPLCAVFGGHVYVAYTGKSGMLSLDIDQRYRSLTGSAPLEPDRARWRVVRNTGLRGVLDRLPRAQPRVEVLEFEIPFGEVHTLDDTVIEGSILVGEGEPRPARIVTRPGGAWLVGTLEQVPGEYPLTLRFHDRDVDPGLVAEITGEGELRFA